MFPLDKWDYRWLEEAKLRATYSKDPSTKVGAVIAKGKKHVSFGYNGFPSSCSDDPSIYLDRPTKYKLVTHAELNAILNSHIPVVGATVYTWPLAPCASCATLLASAGISRVVSRIDPEASKTASYLDVVDTEFILNANNIPYTWIWII